MFIHHLRKLKINYFREFYLSQTTPATTKFAFISVLVVWLYLKMGSRGAVVRFNLDVDEESVPAKLATTYTEVCISNIDFIHLHLFQQMKFNFSTKK